MKSMKRLFVRTCQRYSKLFTDEGENISDIMDKLAEARDITYEASSSMHVTASGIILSFDSRQIAAILHRGDNLLLQPGGHLETGETPVSAARREIKEETGFDHEISINRWHLINGSPLDIQRHRVACTATKVTATHVDFRYFFQVRLPGIHSKEVTWVDVDDVLAKRALSTVSRAAEKAVKLGFVRPRKAVAESPQLILPSLNRY